MEVSEERFREIVEASQVGIGVIDGNQAVSYVNAKAADMIGYAQEEVIGKPLCKKEAVSELIRGSDTLSHAGVVSLFIFHILFAESSWDAELQY